MYTVANPNGCNSILMSGTKGIYPYPYKLHVSVVLMSVVTAYVFPCATGVRWIQSGKIGEWLEGTKCIQSGSSEFLSRVNVN